MRRDPAVVRGRNRNLRRPDPRGSFPDRPVRPAVRIPPPLGESNRRRRNPCRRSVASRKARAPAVAVEAALPLENIRNPLPGLGPVRRFPQHCNPPPFPNRSRRFQGCKRRVLNNNGRCGRFLSARDLARRRWRRSAGCKSCLDRKVRRLEKICKSLRSNSHLRKEGSGCNPLTPFPVCKRPVAEERSRKPGPQAG